MLKNFAFKSYLKLYTIAPPPTLLYVLNEIYNFPLLCLLQFLIDTLNANFSTRVSFSSLF